MNDTELLYAAYLEKREKSKKLLPFPKQEAFINDESQFVLAQCTRRAGKSNALALRFYNTMVKFPGSLCRYIALTSDSARDIMMPVLRELNEIHEWGATFTESPLAMEIPNGSRLRLYGADMKNFIERLRGAKCPANAIDEVQSFGAHLQILIDDIITPTMADYGEDAWLALTGTPGLVPKGIFHDACIGLQGFSVHKWSILDNPHIPGAAKFIEKIKLKNKWPDDHPTYLREWCNKWVIDNEALLIKYKEEINNFDALPQTNPPIKFNYILGVDLGLRDSDALAVLAWSPSTPNIYLVEEIITEDQDISSLTRQIQALQSRYDISKIVMDTGGLGAKIAEELRRRKQIPIHAADKKRKFENVAFLNEYLRLGKFKARKGSRFAEDSYIIQIDWEKTTPDRLVVKTGVHSDIIDAVLYAFRESPAFTYNAPELKPKYGTPEWAKSEEDRMMREAEEWANEQNDIVDDFEKYI